MNCGTVILATQHSSILILVTVLLFLSEDPSLLPSFSLLLSVQVIWWNTWIPAQTTGIGSEIGPMQQNLRGNCWKRALFSFARQEPRSTYSGAAASPCNMWMVLKQQKSEQGDRKRSRNLIISSVPCIPQAWNRISLWTFWKSAKKFPFVFRSVWRKFSVTCNQRTLTESFK